MANPFYIQPANFDRGLYGLSEAVSKAGDRKREEESMQAQEDQEAAAKQEISAAIETKDPTTIQAVMGKYPGQAQNIKAIIETRFPNEQLDFMKTSYMSAALDINKAPEILEDIKTKLGADGFTPEETEGIRKFEELIAGDPDAAKKGFEAGLALLTTGEGRGGYWDRYKDMTKAGDAAKLPTTAMAQFIKNNPDAKAEDLIKFTQDLKAGDTTTALKTYSKKNPDGSTRTIKNVKPGSEQETQLTESGFVEGSQTVGAKRSADERQTERINKATDKLTTMANEDPNKFYKDHSFRQNADGSLYIDPVTGGPKELETFYKATGKRGNIKSIIGLGEQRDDAIELTELLELPSVQANLKKAEGSGFWDQAKSKWTNAINKWMQDQGIKGDSPTATAIARIQRMASEERKLYMGTAVTDNEMRSALAWMPNAGDSFDSVMNKTRLMGDEADQAFIRYVDVFEQAGADMSPFMSAFGIDRFGEEQEEQPASEKTDEDLIKSLGL